MVSPREKRLDRDKRELSDFVPEGLVMVARQFIAWETQKKRDPSRSDGAIRSDRNGLLS